MYGSPSTSWLLLLLLLLLLCCCAAVLLCCCCWLASLTISSLFSQAYQLKLEFDVMLMNATPLPLNPHPPTQKSVMRLVKKKLLSRPEAKKFLEQYSKVVAQALMKNLKQKLGVSYSKPYTVPRLPDLVSFPPPVTFDVGGSFFPNPSGNMLTLLSPPACGEKNRGWQIQQVS